MFNETVLLVLFPILILTGCNQETSSIYSQDKFKIDGKLDEWTDHPLLTIENQPVSLGIRNDNNNLYLMIATRSEHMIRTFQNHGLTLWLNNDNKKKKDFGLVFYPDFDLPKREEPDMFDKRTSPEMLEKMKQRSEEMRGKKEVIIKSNRITLNSENSSVESGYALYKGVYLIEVKIPFGPYDFIDHAYTFQPESKITVGFMSGMKRNKMRREFENSGFGDQQGRGGFTGDGFGEPGSMDAGRRDMESNRRIQFNRLELWLSIKLEHQNQS